MKDEWYQQKKLDEMRNQTKALLDIRDALLAMVSVQATGIQFSEGMTYEIGKSITDAYKELTNGIKERWSE